MACRRENLIRMSETISSIDMHCLTGQWRLWLLLSFVLLVCSHFIQKYDFIQAIIRRWRRQTWLQLQLIHILHKHIERTLGIMLGLLHFTILTRSSNTLAWFSFFFFASKQKTTKMMDWDFISFSRAVVFFLFVYVFLLVLSKTNWKSNKWMRVNARKKLSKSTGREQGR